MSAAERLTVEACALIAEKEGDRLSRYTASLADVIDENRAGAAILGLVSPAEARGQARAIKDATAQIVQAIRALKTSEASAPVLTTSAAQEAAGDALQADVEMRAARKATAACAATVDHEIAPVLVVSTAHVTQAEAADFSDAPVRTMEDTFGALVHAPPHLETGAVWNSFPNLPPLLAYARSLGCLYVLLDRDADKLPESSGLPVFEW